MLTLQGTLVGKHEQMFKGVMESMQALASFASAFTEEMRRIFDQPFKSEDSAPRLFSSSQCNHSIVQYSIDFRVLAAESGFNDHAL